MLPMEFRCELVFNVKCQIKDELMVISSISDLIAPTTVWVQCKLITLLKQDSDLGIEVAI